MSDIEDDNYLTGEETLWKAASRSDIPLIVRVNETYQNKNYDDAGWFEDGMELMVEGTRSIPYARVRVLDVHDEEQARKAHSDDFVDERQMFLDQVYLMPMHVPLKLKLVTRPGKPNKYTSIAQVIEDMPMKLLVDRGVISIPPGGGHHTLVPANTVLTVKRVFTCSIDKARYLQCSFQSQHVSFKETLRVHFSAIGDDSLYTMSYLQMTNVFPTVFEFLNPKPDDVVHYVDYEANAALIIAEGPLEILGIERLNVVLAWKRQQEAKSYSTLVIPESRAKTLMAQKRHFKHKFIKNNYMQRRYTACTHLDFVFEKLYLIPQDPSNAVCLKSPNLFFFDPNAGRLRMTKNGIIFNLSTDEESYDSDDVYADIAPPKQERIPITCPQALQNVKKKLGLFHKIHEEIKSLFKRKAKSRRRTRRDEQMREPGECLSNPLYRRSKSMSDIDKLEDNATRNVRNIRTMVSRKPSAPPPGCNDPQHNNILKRSIPSTLNKFNSSFLTEGFMKPTPRVPSTPSKSKSESSSPTDAYTTKINSFSPRLSRSRSASRSPSEIPRESRPLSALVSSHSHEESDNYIILCHSVPPQRSTRAPRSPEPHRPAPPIPLESNTRNHVIANAKPSDHLEALPVTTHSEEANEKAGYATISKKCMESILCPRQTSEDFYKYSVIELYHLLTNCNLHDIAYICFEHRYDGKFFANVDVQELLQDQPFSVSNIQILKFKKLRDGWRPSTYT